MRIYQTKKLLDSKGNSQQSTRLWTEREKFSAHNTTDRGAIHRIYKKPQKLSNSKMNNPLKKWAKEMNVLHKNKFKWLIDI